MGREPRAVMLRMAVSEVRVRLAGGETGGALPISSSRPWLV
jgi:hypothetical protein